MAILLGGTVLQGSATPSTPFRTSPYPLSLPGGTTWTSPPGPHMVNPGHYSELQEFDSVLGVWRKARSPMITPLTIDSDGANYRLANTTGMAVGALITNGGTSYTTNPTITASFGGSKWASIIGGSINTTIA